MQVPWRRIILDEAHSIKDRRCSTAKAVFALDSRYKWALKGEECGCKSLDYLFRLNHRKCDECG